MYIYIYIYTNIWLGPTVSALIRKMERLWKHMHNLFLGDFGSAQPTGGMAEGNLVYKCIQAHHGRVCTDSVRVGWDRHVCKE